MNQLIGSDGIDCRKQVKLVTVSPRNFRYGVYYRGFLGKLWLEGLRKSLVPAARSGLALRSFPLLILIHPSAFE